VAQQLKSFLILFSSNRKIMLFLSFIILLLLGCWVLGKLATQFLDDSSTPVLQAKNVVFNTSVAQGKSSYLLVNLIRLSAL